MARRDLKSLMTLSEVSKGILYKATVVTFVRVDYEGSVYPRCINYRSNDARMEVLYLCAYATLRR